MFCFPEPKSLVGKSEMGMDPPQAKVAVAACPLTAEERLRRRVVSRFCGACLVPSFACILAIEEFLNILLETHRKREVS